MYSQMSFCNVFLLISPDRQLAPSIFIPQSNPCALILHLGNGPKMLKMFANHTWVFKPHILLPSVKLFHGLEIS